MQRLTSDHWQKVLAAEKDPDLRAALDGASLPHWQEAYHVAVDRWTGGAAESFLYTVLEPHRVAWEPLRLTVDLARLAGTNRLPAVALLLLVLRDLSQGRLPLGFATHRGMGAVQVSSVTVTPKGTGDPLKNLKGTVYEDGRSTKVLADSRGVLNQHWQGWIESASKKEGSA